LCIAGLLCIAAMADPPAPRPGTTTNQGTGNVGQGNTTYTVTSTVASSTSTQAGVTVRLLRANGNRFGVSGVFDIDDCIIIVTVNTATKEKAKINVCDGTCTLWKDTDDDGEIDPANPGDPEADPPVPPTPAESSINLPQTSHTPPPA